MVKIIRDNARTVYENNMKKQKIIRMFDH
jgi:hypothetical protein